MSTADRLRQHWTADGVQGNPDGVPASTGELTEIARAVEELYQLVAQFTEASPPRGRGLSYVAARLAAVEQGTFGERGIARYREQTDAQRRTGIMEPSLAQTNQARWNAFYLQSCRELGGKIRGSTVQWPWRLEDRDGRRRTRQARKRADDAYTADQAQRNGGAR